MTDMKALAALKETRDIKQRVYAGLALDYDALRAKKNDAHLEYERAHRDYAHAVEELFDVTVIGVI